MQQTDSFGILPSYRQSHDFSWLTEGRMEAHFSGLSFGPLPVPPHSLIAPVKTDGTHWSSVTSIVFTMKDLHHCGSRRGKKVPIRHH